MAEVNVTPASPVQVARVTLTSAQLLAIFTTAVTIVPAPGAGLVLVPFTWTANYTFVTTAYTDHLGVLLLQWGGAGGLQVGSSGITTAGLWDQTHSTFGEASGFSRSAANVSTQLANMPLSIQQNTANPTLGDGTLTATVAYMVVAAS